jgi:hypothetical protein
MTRNQMGKTPRAFMIENKNSANRHIIINIQPTIFYLCRSGTYWLDPR